MLVIVSNAQIANAESVADKAVSFAKTLRDDAANTVQIALDRVASAEVDQRIAQAISREAYQAKDKEALSVATQAVAEAKQGLVEAEQLLKRARDLLAARDHTMKKMELWVDSKKRVGALVVPIEGDVRVLKPDGSSRATPLSSVQAGDKIETGSHSRVRLFVADGNGEIDLKENSSFKVVENDWVNGFSGVLERGFSRLRMVTQDFLRKKFEVRTIAFVGAARGTDFALKVEKNGEMIQVFQGTVIVTPLSGGDPFEVEAGTQRRFLYGQGFLQPEPLDIPDQAPWSTSVSNH